MPSPSEVAAPVVPMADAARALLGVTLADEQWIADARAVLEQVARDAGRVTAPDAPAGGWEALGEKSEAWWLARADREGDAEVGAGRPRPGFAEYLSAVSFARSIVNDPSRAALAAPTLHAHAYRVLLNVLAGVPKGAAGSQP